MSKRKMTMKAMETAPENQAGSYGTSFWFQLIVSWADKKFPGAGDLIEQASDILPWSKLGKAIFNAYADFQEGKVFIEILKEALAEWVEIEEAEGDEPIRMTAKED